MSNKSTKAKTLLELEANECRWPLGDPRQSGFHFCGAQQVLGRPYCVEHWQMSFVPGKGRSSPSALPLAAPTALPAPAKRAA
ncbi:MAG: GcrA family cell cycle regulator [Hyphomicrobiaceae bacterium]|nr:GcrA family cell cycle regulator [Hyphomicrobiaceae bacterium]